MSARILRFLRDTQPETPCLVIDLGVVAEKYLEMQRELPLARIFYAVKANPAPEILATLTQLGACFDVASPAEVDACLAAGATSDRISYGNPIKKERDIAYAFGRGVNLFALDSEAELKKLSRAAPGASVFCRLVTDCSGADWPLTRKFGCSPETAVTLLLQARDSGMDPAGVSFHVGSQQMDMTRWDGAIAMVAQLFRTLRDKGLDLRMANLGGGFPARYDREVEPMTRYARSVMEFLTYHFGNDLPEIIVEPGRSIVGDAGILQTEVVLIAPRDGANKQHWIFLDVGKYGGLAETIDETTRYRIRSTCQGTPVSVVLAGPTCDSTDVLYENNAYEMPSDLQIGDKIEILSAGAYTNSYASVGFNGFAPLRTYCVGPG